MAGITIELDRDPLGAVAPEAALSPRWRRLLALALATIAVLATLVASAPVRDDRLRQIATVHIPEVITEQLTTESLYAVVLEAGPHLVRYRLRDGGRQWSSPLPTGAAATSIDVLGDTVLVGFELPSSQGNTTIALDAGTGRELWHSELPMMPGLGRGGAVVLGASLDADGTQSLSPYGELLTEPAPGPLRLRAVEPHSGRQIWSYRIPAGWWTALPHDPFGTDTSTGFVTAQPDGRATVVDLRTGAARATGRISLGSTPRGANPTGPLLAVRDNRLIVGYLAGNTPILASYKLEKLVQQWSRAVSTVDIGVSVCPPLLCLFDQDGIRAVQPDTGAVSWTAPVSDWDGFLNGWLYYAPGPFQRGSARLVDPFRRHTVLDLGEWRLAVRVTDRPVLVEMADDRSSRIRLGLITAGPGVQALGVASDLPQNSCDVNDTYLVCLTTARQLRIWRYR